MPVLLSVSLRLCWGGNEICRLSDTRPEPYLFPNEDCSSANYTHRTKCGRYTSRQSPTTNCDLLSIHLPSFVIIFLWKCCYIATSVPSVTYHLTNNEILNISCWTICSWRNILKKLCDRYIRFLVQIIRRWFNCRLKTNYLRKTCLLTC